MVHQSGFRRVDRRGSRQLPPPQRRWKEEKRRSSVRKGEKKSSTESRGLGKREIANSDSSSVVPISYRRRSRMY